jgi:UDP-N-acetylglucosamine 2-epimerase
MRGLVKIPNLSSCFQDRRLKRICGDLPESWGCGRNLVELSHFVKHHEDVVLVFPVHLNPAVKHVAQLVLADQPRVFLEEPLGYEDFVGLATESWVLVSDSGGVQEEAPSLGKPVLILRENTERLEGIQAGVAKLVGGCAGRLTEPSKKPTPRAPGSSASNRSRTRSRRICG